MSDPVSKTTARRAAIEAVKREAWRHSFGPDRDIQQQQNLLAAVEMLEAADGK